MSVLDSTSFTTITSVETLVRAHKKALAGKRSNQHATKSNYHFMSELLKVQHELIDSTYVPRPYRQKIITEPKVRQIKAPAFRDRIVHHAIHSVLSPFYERHFIYDSYACRQGKGIHKAMARVQQFLRANPDVYVCRIDISKYYGSVNHQKLHDLLARKIKDERLLELLDTIISSSDSGTEYDDLFPPDSYFHTKGRRGIPIGNLTSQLFANIYLHEVDMYAKQTLKIRRYIRYMDDILIFHEDKTQLHIWQAEITAFLYEELYLTVNPRKVRVYPSRLGVDFVGYILYPQTKQVRASSVRRFRRRFHKQLKGMIEGRISATRVNDSFESWAAHVRHGNGEPLIEQSRAKKDDAMFIRWVLKRHYKQQHKQQEPTQ